MINSSSLTQVICSWVKSCEQPRTLPLFLRNAGGNIGAMPFPFRLIFSVPCLCQADSKQTAVLLTVCLDSVCSSGVLIYKVLLKYWIQHKQEISPWKVEVLYLFGNANEIVNIKKRRIWPIVRSRWVRTGKSSHARQEETQRKKLWNKLRSPTLEEQLSWLPPLDVSNPSRRCNIAGCDRFSGPHTLGENMCKGHCSPVHLVSSSQGCRRRRICFGVGCSEIQHSLVLSKLAEVWSWDTVWHLVPVWLLTILQKNV